MTSSRKFLILGGSNAMLAVIFGAFGAHAVRDLLSVEMLAVYHTSAQYHFWHALGLIAVGLVARQLGKDRLLSVAGWFMLAGIVLFCGSLYALSLSGLRALGIITPFGGMSFIIAWLLFVVAVVRSSEPGA